MEYKHSQGKKLHKFFEFEKAFFFEIDGKIIETSKRNSSRFSQDAEVKKAFGLVRVIL